jgi:hypothetical protein
MEVTIDNRCSNIKLTSPIHFTKNTTCHVHFPQKVDSRNMTKVNFMTGIDEDTFGGALLYHLQREDNNESVHQFDADKNVSTNTQLLVFWRCELNEFYSFAVLIEHENTLIWNEDKLEEFYHIYDRQYNIGFTFDWKIFSLNDNTTLKVKCRQTHGGFKMNIFISEEKKQRQPVKPLWIDSNR